MINAIIVDDSSLCVDMLYEICSSYPELNISKFTKPYEAAAFSKTSFIDLAFLDVDMPVMDGIELGQILRNSNPNMVLIYVSSKEESCSDAMRLKADGYIFKPYSVADISYAINKARLLSNNLSHSIYIKTFGNFEIYSGREIIHFCNAKAKELLALCIDYCGSDVSIDYAVSALWPDRPNDDKVKRLYRKAVSSVRDTLSDYTSVPIFTNSRGSCRILPENISCDYYSYLNNRKKFRHLASGTYLQQYSWAKERATAIAYELLNQ